jgi:hypothetical protein
LLVATVDIAIWSCTEQGLAITAGSLATLRPLLRNVGYCFGLSTTPGPTELKDSENRLPTIGGHSSRKSKGLRTDPYSLTAIDRHGENHNNNSSDENVSQDMFGSHHKDGRIAPWEAQGRSHHHGSEEGLAQGGSGTNWDGDWKSKDIVQVQSVTVSSSSS